VVSDKIGSPKKMYELLEVAAYKYGGVSGNAYDKNQVGSYLTMASSGGMIFGIINIVGNFGTVFCDQAYWQRAVAARPSSTVTGYIIGGLCWFAIPFFLATTLGLACVALELNPAFPTYPSRLSADAVGAGLPAPNAAVALMGPSGACAILILVFLAVTSALSAELIAVSSLITYDVYRVYINPNATGKQIIDVQHYATVGFGIIMGVLASVLNNFGITLGYLYLLMGIIVAPAVIPIAFTLTWKKQSAAGAIVSSIFSFLMGVTTWLATAGGMYGKVTVETTGMNYPMLAGNLVSLLLPFFITVPMSLVAPQQNFDWDETREQITFVADEEEIAKKVEYDRDEEENPEKLNAAMKVAYAWAWALTGVLIFLFPLPLLGERYIFSTSFFTFWVVIGFMWTWVAALTVTIWPVYESLGGVTTICTNLLQGKSHSKIPSKEVEIEIVDVSSAKQ